MIKRVRARQSDGKSVPSLLDVLYTFRHIWPWIYYYFPTSLLYQQSTPCQRVYVWRKYNNIKWHLFVWCEYEHEHQLRLCICVDRPNWLVSLHDRTDDLSVNISGIGLSAAAVELFAFLFQRFSVILFRRYLYQVEWISTLCVTAKKKPKQERIFIEVFRWSCCCVVCEFVESFLLL